MNWWRDFVWLQNAASKAASCSAHTWSQQPRVLRDWHSEEIGWGENRLPADVHGHAPSSFMRIFWGNAFWQRIYYHIFICAFYGTSHRYMPVWIARCFEGHGLNELNYLWLAPGRQLEAVECTLSQTVCSSVSRYVCQASSKVDSYVECNIATVGYLNMA